MNINPLILHLGVEKDHLHEVKEMVKSYSGLSLLRMLESTKDNKYLVRLTDRQNAVVGESKRFKSKDKCTEIYNEIILSIEGPKSSRLVKDDIDWGDDEEDDDLWDTEDEIDWEDDDGPDDDDIDWDDESDEIDWS